MADSSVAVRLCRYSVFAERAKLGLWVQEAKLQHGVQRIFMYDLPKRFHELVSKVAITEEKIVSQGRQVIEELEFVDKDFKEAVARKSVCRVN